MEVHEKIEGVEPKYDKNDPDVMITPGWEPADDYYDSLYHFKWKPTSGGIKYDMTFWENYVNEIMQLTTPEMPRFRYGGLV